MWWLIITIIVCTYFIIKVVKEQGPEGQQKKVVKEIEVLEKQVEFWREQIMHKEPDLVEAEILDKLRADFVNMGEKYNLFREREKDSKKVLEFVSDFKDYAEALFHLKMAWCIFQTDLSNEAVDKYSEKLREHGRIKEGVEKKLA